MFNLENAEYRLENLLTASQNLRSDYQKKRQEMDEARTLGKYRPYTHNQQRLDYITFIENLTKFVIENRYNYRLTLFSSRSYDQVLTPLLTKIILGAYLLELINITKTYSAETSVLTDTALGAIILNFFKIEKLSDIANEIQADCLTSLQSYLTKIPVREKIFLHPLKNCDDFIAEISSFLKTIVPYPVEPSILDGYLKF